MADIALPTSPSAAPEFAPGRRPRRGRLALPALGAGLLLALSVPPVGWWPLGPVGLAILGHLLAGRPRRARAALGLSAGLGLYAVTLFFLVQFNALGAGLVIALEASFLMLAAMATPPGKWRPLAWPAAVALSDAGRGLFPWGGLPMGGIDLGQAAGPLAPTARLGGALLLAALVATAGLGLEAAAVLLRRLGQASATATVPWTRLSAGVALVAVATVGIPAVGAASADGRAIGQLRTAVVQGGGRRGLRAINNPPIGVYNAQIAATATVRPPVDLVLWPENIIALDGPLVGSAPEAEVTAEADRLGATIVAGITEPLGTSRFRNAAVAWAPNQGIVARYDKVHRVPFGEFVPGRSLITHFVNLDAVPRDAAPGHSPGLLRTPAGPMGVVISFEVFYADRARSAIRAGGQVLLVPTNTASYTTAQIPDAEIASAKLRAWETGRDVVMAAPTGFSAIISARGQVWARSGLGNQQVLLGSVARRTGTTPYLRWGDGPVVSLALVALAAAWALSLLDHSINTSKP